MLRINQLKLHPGHTKEELENKICSFLRIKKEDLKEMSIVKQSIDARKKPEIFFTYTIDVKVSHEKMDIILLNDVIGNICEKYIDRKSVV